MVYRQLIITTFKLLRRNNNMLFSAHNYGQKKEFLEKFLLYYDMQLKIEDDRKSAFEFAQKNFFNDYGFLLYKEIDLFLSEIIEIKDGKRINKK